MSKHKPLYRAALVIIAAFAVALCWRGVSWAFRPGLMLVTDEINNLTRFLGASWFTVVQPIPHALYNDRPAGFALEGLLFDLFGFNYTRQLAVFLTLHFASCAMAFALFRKLGLNIFLCLTAVGVYGSLNTTAQTATFIGAVFDVLCLFFILGSMLTLLAHWRGSWSMGQALSAFLFFMALLSKEFAVVVPILLALLLLADQRSGIKALLRRLWPHLVIGVAFLLRFAYLAPKMMRETGPGDPYRMDLRLSTVLHAFAYYTSWMLNAELMRRGKQYIVAGLILLGILIGGIILRNARIYFALAAYILLLLPVALIPGIRAPYYLYAPQLFLIFAAFLLMDGILKSVVPPGRHWIAAAALAVVCLAVATPYERGRHFLDNANFVLGARAETARSAKDVLAQFGPVPAGSHVYVNRGTRTPWLFQAGPCAFLQVLNRQRGITCVMDGSPSALQTLYAQDKGPKFYVDYQPGGSLTDFMRSP
ncbi:MAG TPA: hypothetical protein VG273_14760 [Bryobacteraceae bacterium]|jgi:hypothetical protein|nr:hypothetical protein [Bryobacteraceae bacterium]